MTLYMIGYLAEDVIENESELFQNARKNLSTAVNMTIVYSYYEAGRMIVEEEQGGKERAAYGKYILKELSQRLTKNSEEAIHMMI